MIRRLRRRPRPAAPTRVFSKHALARNWPVRSTDALIWPRRCGAGVRRCVPGTDPGSVRHLPAWAKPYPGLPRIRPANFHCVGRVPTLPLHLLLKATQRPDERTTFKEAWARTILIGSSNLVHISLFATTISSTMSLGSITSTTHGETDLWPGQLFAPAVGPLFTTSHPSHPYYHHRTQRSWSQPSSAPVRGQLLAPARSASLPRASLRLLPSADRSGQYQEHAAECSRLPHRRQRSSNESTAQSCPLFDKLPVEVLRDISSFVQASGSSTTWLRGTCTH